VTLLQIHESEKAGKKAAAAFWRSLVSDEHYAAMDTERFSRLQLLLKAWRLEEAEEKSAIEKVCEEYLFCERGETGKAECWCWWL